MAKTGRKPKPTALKMLEGNPGKRPLPEFEPKNYDPPSKPTSVSVDAFASAEWDRILNAMPPGIYTALDATVLAEYALAWSMLVRSQQELDAFGLILEEPIVGRVDKQMQVIGHIRKMNPALKSWQAATQTLLKVTDRLGLNPSVRTRLQLPTKQEAPQSKFAGLLSRNPGAPTGLSSLSSN